MSFPPAYDQTVAVRAGEELNIPALEQYLEHNLPGFGGITAVKQFPGGYSNLTYLLQTPNADYVLRRPPFGANIKTAHDMGREYSVLSLLHQVYPKVPHPILYCPQTTVIGAPFYLMQRINGVILRNQPPEGIDLSPALLRQISEATVDNLAQLHGLDVEQTGLLSLGKPDGYVQRQVSGWIQRYQKAETDAIPDMNLLARWMPENIPQTTDIAFIHNDYKYDNLVLNPNSLTQIIAVLDWEMATIGHPLMDVGTTLAYWAQPNDHPALIGFSLTSRPGNLTRTEALQRYAQNSGLPVHDFVFYYAFGCFKIGVICQQIYARYKKGLTTDPRFATLLLLVKAIAHNGVRAIQSGYID